MIKSKQTDAQNDQGVEAGRSYDILASIRTYADMIWDLRKDCHDQEQAQRSTSVPTAPHSLDYDGCEKLQISVNEGSGRVTTKAESWSEGKGWLRSIERSR